MESRIPSTAEIHMEQQQDRNRLPYSTHLIISNVKDSDFKAWIQGLKNTDWIHGIKCASVYNGYLHKECAFFQGEDPHME